MDHKENVPVLELEELFEPRFCRLNFTCPNCSTEFSFVQFEPLVDLRICPICGIELPIGEGDERPLLVRAVALYREFAAFVGEHRRRLPLKLAIRKR